MSVLITYPHAVSVGHRFHVSMIRTVKHYGDEIEDVMGVRCYPGDGLVQGRNEAMRKFLDDYKSEWLWTLDTDIGFPITALKFLMSHGDPVVSGLYHTVYELDAAEWTVGSCAYVVDGSNGMTRVGSQGGIHGVDAVGAGCLLVHRDAAMRVRDEYGDTWWTPYGGYGEDISFCRRLKACDIPITLDATFELTHQKTVWV